MTGISQVVRRTTPEVEAPREPRVSYRVIAACGAGGLLLGLIGVFAGPRWAPERFTPTIAVQTSNTQIDGVDAPVAIGTYPVRTEVVSVQLDGAQIDARVSMPVGAPGPRPAVLFVHGAGTGQYARAFLAQANSLASSGVITMVPNKRLDTYSTRHRNYVSMADDYLRSLEVLVRRPDVDPARVGVYGESEGGWIVPVMAAQSPDVAFAILVSAPVVPPRQQAAFAVDSYMRNTGIPSALRRAIPRVLGMKFPGGGFEYLDFDVSPYQRRMTQPILMAYGTGDASMPIIQGPEQVIADVAVAGNTDVTVRYYGGGTHGIRVDGAVSPDFLRDISAWVLGLPGDAHAEPWVAGAAPYQRYQAVAVGAPRWYANGDWPFGSVLLGAALILLGPLVLLVARVFGRRRVGIAPDLRRPLFWMGACSVGTMLGLVGYLYYVARLALNYQQAPLQVGGGWVLLRLLGIASVLAAAVVGLRLLAKREKAHQKIESSRIGVFVVGTTVIGSTLLLLALSYWGVFPLGLA
jgi:dienelactone hydrolase